MHRAQDRLSRARDDALIYATVVLLLLVVFLSPTAAALLHSGQLLLVEPSATARGWIALVREDHWADPVRGFPREARRASPAAAGWWASIVWMAVVFVGALFAIARAIDMKVAAPTLARRWWQPSGARPRAWARPRDLEPLHVREWDGDRLALGAIGRRRQKLAAIEEDHVLLVAPTGAGKTTRFIVRWALRQRGPIISLSMKRDVFDATHRWRREVGRVWVWDPFGPGRCARWSPLLGCELWSGALRRSTWLASVGSGEGSSSDNATFWRTEGSKLLAPLLHAAALGDLGMADVLRWLDARSDREPMLVLERAAAAAEQAIERIGQTLALDGADTIRWIDGTPEEKAALTARIGSAPTASALQRDPQLVDDLRTFERGRHASAAADQLEAVLGLDARNSGSTYMSAGNLLAAYRHPAVLAADGVDDFSPAAFLDGENTLYIVAGTEDQEMLAPVIVALLSELFAAAERRAAEGRPVNRRLWVLADELMNIAPIRQLPRYLATIRSANAVFVSVVQDLGQVRSRFGADDANTILSNSRCKIFLGPITDGETRRYLLDALGDEVVSSRSRTTGERPSTTVSETHKPRASAQMLQQLDGNRALVVSGSLPAAVIFHQPWWEENMLRARYHPKELVSEEFRPIERPSAISDRSRGSNVTSVATPPVADVSAVPLSVASPPAAAGPRAAQ